MLCCATIKHFAKVYIQPVKLFQIQFNIHAQDGLHALLFHCLDLFLLSITTTNSTALTEFSCNHWWKLIKYFTSALIASNDIVSALFRYRSKMREDDVGKFSMSILLCRFTQNSFMVDVKRGAEYSFLVF